MAEVAAHITAHVLPLTFPSASGCWAFRSRLLAVGSGTP